MFTFYWSLYWSSILCLGGILLWIYCLHLVVTIRWAIVSYLLFTCKKIHNTRLFNCFLGSVIYFHWSPFVCCFIWIMNRGFNRKQYTVQEKNPNRHAFIYQTDKGYRKLGIKLRINIHWLGLIVCCLVLLPIDTLFNVSF
jgi:hypothetical protein